MGRLAFCTDENVPRAFATALDSNGFTVFDADEVRGENTVDEALLQWANSNECTLVTNDRDFAELDVEYDHAGIMIYSDQALSPGEFVKAIRRLNRHYSPDEMRNELVWLGNWMQ